MHEINKSQFGQFLSARRKEKGYTQKELAQKLFLSDKAVSKWERGISLPDISLLIPLSDILDVTKKAGKKPAAEKKALASFYWLLSFGTA